MQMRKKGKRPIKNSKEPLYYNYGKIGHFKVDYFKKKKDEKAKEKHATRGKKKMVYKKKGKKAMAAV